MFFIAEGFYLSQHKFFHSQYVVKGDSLLSSQEFLFAERDLTDRNVYNLYTHLSQKTCLQLLSTLRALSRLNDEFIRLEDTNGSPYIVYANS